MVELASPVVDIFRLGNGLVSHPNRSPRFLKGNPGVGDPLLLLEETHIKPVKKTAAPQELRR